MDKDISRRAYLLLSRLERISADSPWAHQASGIRASLAKSLSRKDSTRSEIEELLQQGFQILERAAGEIPDPHEHSGV
jgi:hypothetical protein